MVSRLNPDCLDDPFMAEETVIRGNNIGSRIVTVGASIKHRVVRIDVGRVVVRVADTELVAGSATGSGSVESGGCVAGAAIPLGIAATRGRTVMDRCGIRRRAVEVTTATTTDRQGRIMAIRAGQVALGHDCVVMHCQIVVAGMTAVAAGPGFFREIAAGDPDMTHATAHIGRGRREGMVFWHLGAWRMAALAVLRYDDGGVAGVTGFVIALGIGVVRQLIAFRICGVGVAKLAIVGQGIIRMADGAVELAGAVPEGRELGVVIGPDRYR